MTQASGWIQTDKENEMRVIVTQALRSLRWQNISAQPGFSEATADRFDRVRGPSTFEYEYTIIVSWNSQPGWSHFEIKVSETRYNAAQKLQQLADEVAQKMLSSGERFITHKETYRPDTHGTARWAEQDELVSAGYITDYIDPERFILAPYNNHYLALPPAETFMHAMVCGPTGAGKSSGFFIPNICERTNCSALITEATAGDEVPELFAKTAGWRSFKDNKIYYFNPSHMNSTRINPIDLVARADPERRTSLADEIANLVILNTSGVDHKSSDPIWDRAERYLLFIFILHVVAEGDPEQMHFGGIRNLLARDEKELSAILVESKSEIAAQEYGAFITHSSENFRHGCFSSVLQRLNSWLTDEIVTLTKTTDIDLDELQNELFTFYLSVPSRKPHMKPIAALVFNFLLDYILDSPRFAHPMALYLDEFTNFGFVPGIDTALSIVRKRNLGIVLGIQDYMQLQSVYRKEKANIIWSQIGTKVIFQPRDFQTAKQISDMLGRKTVPEWDTSGGSVILRHTGRWLMSADELQKMGTNSVIIQLLNAPPVQTPRFTYQTYPPPQGYPMPALPKHPVEKIKFTRPTWLKTASKRKETVKREHDKDITKEMRTHITETEKTQEKKLTNWRKALSEGME